MRADEAHQQQLEQQEEETTALLQNGYGQDVKAHIWGDDETVFINFSTYPLSLSLHLEKHQAEKIVEMLNNAMRGMK